MIDAIPVLKTDRKITSEDCHRFHTCNAAICPLDPSWRKAVHLDGESVCYYLLGSAKVGAAEYYGDDPAYLECAKLADEVGQTFPAIGRAIQIASRSGFRGSNLRTKTAKSDHSHTDNTVGAIQFTS